MLDEVGRLLRELRGAWAQIGKATQNLTIGEVAVK